MIREQAAEKHLDPALIAAVIYAETKFEPRTSSAGAQGLMQILPETAYFIAAMSGGMRFTAERPRDAERSTWPTAAGTCATCSTTTTATRCSRWRPTTAAWRTSTDGSRGARANRASADGRATIPFPETRAYVQRVLSAPAGVPARPTRASSGSAERADAAAPAARAATVGARCPTSSSTPSSRPTADQPQAIESLAEGVRRGRALPDAARRDRHRQDDDDGRA